MTAAITTEWFLDKEGCWSIYRTVVTKNGLRTIHIWLQMRPSYCDRGHWTGNVNGISSIDAADRFPRYYMNLDRAKAEMEDWLTWRLTQERWT